MILLVNNILERVDLALRDPETRDPPAENTHLRSWWDVKTFTGTRLGEQEWLMNRATFPYCTITAKIVICQ